MLGVFGTFAMYNQTGSIPVGSTNLNKMCSKLDRIEEILGEKWKGKYILDWCYECDTARITCLECKNGSCSGGGCDKCINDFDEFHKSKTCVESYLTEEERRIYDKCLRIRKLILTSLRIGDSKIDWKKLQKDGELSSNDEKVFKEELS